MNFGSKYKTRQAFGWDFCGGCRQRRKQSDVHHRFLLIMIISVARLRKLTEPGPCLLPQPLQDGVEWGGISLGRGGQATPVCLCGHEGLDHSLYRYIVLIFFIFKQQMFMSHTLGAGKSKIKTLADLASGKNLSPDLMDGHFLIVAS